MTPDLAFTPAATRVDVPPRQVPRQQIAAAASSASSPGRRPRPLRAREGTPRGDPDAFTHQGTAHRLVRFTPGDEPIEHVPRRQTTVDLPTQAGHARVPATVTARSAGLVHVVFTDENGDAYGTWCPAGRLGAGGEVPDA